jgi:hypothetical protein
MCNPRRVRVRATRQVEQAWQEEVLRRVTRSQEVIGEARIREPLGAGIGAPTLAALASVLETAPGWEWNGTAFTHQVDGGQVSYDPVSRELEISAQVAATVSAEGEARATLTGTMAETLEAEGTGTYYDDGWGGRTADTAHAEATSRAEDALQAAVRERLARLRAEAEQQAGEGLDSAAAAEAERALAQAGDARRAELQLDAAQRLAAVGVQGRNLFHAALAEAYRDAILAYARNHGADGIRCVEADGVVEIQFEIPA